MIFKIEKTKNFTVMSNQHLREKDMSLKAKGLLSLMLSLPEDWDYSVKGLCLLTSDKKDSIKAALKELRDFGYLVIKKLLPNETESGRIEYEYIVYEVSQKTRAEKQGLEKQALEKQALENPLQLNTNIVNTNNKVLNNKDYTTTIYTQEDYELREQFVAGGTKCAMLIISNAQIDSLKRELTDIEFDIYLPKMVRMISDDYEFSCSHYEMIMRMVKEDRRVKK